MRRTLAWLVWLCACADDPVTVGQSLEEPEVAYYAVGPGNVVRAVNRATTLCSDGTYAAECPIDGLAPDAPDLRAGLASGRLIVRGQLAGTLSVRAAWLGVLDPPPTDVDYLRITDTGILCVTAPCPSMHASLLNTSDGQDIAALDFSKSGARPDQVDAATAAEHGRGLLIAGYAYVVTGPAGALPGYVVTQLYLGVTLPLGSS
jgi:hypothetical protein